MKLFISALYLVFSAGSAFAQDPLNPNDFQAGIYGDSDRTVTCVSGPAGTVFDQVVWAWVPDDLGLAYITLRFAFPTNVDFSAHPVFHELVLDYIITEFTGGTMEWNMIVGECPSGWIQIFSQQCTLLDDQQSEITILGENSMMRDCRFILNDLSVLNHLKLNDPECGTTITRGISWDSLKSIYQH